MEAEPWGEKSMESAEKYLGIVLPRRTLNNCGLRNHDREEPVVQALYNILERTANGAEE